MDVNLSELDDWLGTLEELQLGLELCHSVTAARQQDSNASPVGPSAAVTPGSGSCVNRTFTQEVSDHRHPVSSTRAPMAHVNLVAQESAGSYENTTFAVLGSHLPQNAKPASVNGAELNESPIGMANKVVPIGTVDRHHKEATAERDLSSLLQELEVVEERMKELESENTTFTRRYSLASSPQAQRLPDHVLDSTDFTSATAGLQAGLNLGVSSPQLTAASSIAHASTAIADKATMKPMTNGFVSVQWAAQLKPDLSMSDREQSSSPPPPPPPAFLGAGDACVSPPISPQPPTPSISLLQQTEVGIWSMNPQNMIAKDPMMPNHYHPTPKSILNKSNNGATKATQCVDFLGSPDGGRKSPNSLVSSKPLVNRADVEVTGPLQLTHSSQLSPPRSVAVSHAGVRVVDVTHTNNNHNRRIGQSDSLNQSPEGRVNPPSIAIPLPSNAIIESSRQNLSPSDAHYSSTGGVNASGLPANQRQMLGVRSTDGDDESSLSGLGSWSPGQSVPRRDLVKTNSLIGHGGSDGLSNSLSPESSLSDKSFSESADLGHGGVAHSSGNITENQTKKLVVRIFRTDRTTKAILIEENMTAGEVASMMIEKNFLQPSIRLAVVEKVPALKVERVFEEHEKVADCILSWPTRSQNMIFFEEREDHFGLIESPSTWLGEEFVNKYRYASAEAMQMMLNNIEQAGFPEWRDYLYIRKPGEKTWSRRLCVLRSSGLYTSKKNRKTLNPTDLIRILVLDSHLQLYTTTGGWTRMRAPTPHGFAFKPYSAQDPASTHVFCFCATDEKALRNWVARLRIAKYGRQLFIDYQSALARVQRQLTARHGPNGMSFGLNGSLSAGLYRKSSLDFLGTSSNPTLSTAESTTSLVVTTNSPCSHKRYAGSQKTGICVENWGVGEERVSFNQCRTHSVPQQASTAFERIACSPSSASSPHAHIGLCPQTLHQTHAFSRRGGRPCGTPSLQMSHAPGGATQPGHRCG